jgi:ATP-dependent DNA helicase RecQ
MAWLAKTIPTLTGSGIVYTLTQRDAERVTEWLRINDIKAEAYHADVADAKEGSDAEGGSSRREVLEQKLLRNEVKVLVATVALGMGFDKPDLGFVIHFQRPGSVVHYYQQVGRAGRAVDEAFGILLHGEEDDQIADFFISNAFPPQRHVDTILGVLDKADGGLSLRELEVRLSLKHAQLEKALKYLSVETPSPIAKIGTAYNATAAAQDYRIDQGHVDAITAIRRDEQAQMQAYMAHTGCLMEFLARALDDPHATRCGKCAGCLGAPILDPAFDEALANRAAIFLRRSYQPLMPRKLWPSGGALPLYGFSGKISDALRAEEGRALSLWRDAGWGRLVADGKYTTGRFDDQLVGACVEMLAKWQPAPAPEWVTCIPSLNRPELVPDFASRLAKTLGLPFHACLQKAKANPPQKEMQNSFQQASNLDGVFAIVPAGVSARPCLLIDDMRDSGWTFTVAAAVLRKAGATAVYPLALALNSPRMD